MFLATPDGLAVVDMIAVDNAVNGLRDGWSLTGDEAQYAAGILLAHKVPYSVVAARVGRNADTIKRWFPEIEVSETRARGGSRTKSEPAACGTRRGYGAHRRRHEKACGPCKAANAMADRYYRLHGTCVGAPEVAAA
ncbi:hypothetical protein [Streptomyces sp. NPDC005732]|uniref:hypothetical protein n=1 Tax=Streptomyces sp. NPDC005732 TaxID=3157057 RepID=UPI0033D77A57